MKNFVTKTVDGETYQIEQFATTKALNVLSDLVKIVGEPLALAVSGSTLSSEEQSRILGMAVSAMAQRMDKNTVVALVKTLIESCLKGEGAKINFELEFQGKLGHLFKLVYAVLEVQYGSFLGELLGRAGELAKTKGVNLSKQSTGESGELSSVA